MHLGRSRNDQVLAALRFYLRDAIDELAAGRDGCADALDALAARERAIALPGYTHMQQAMPSSVRCGRGFRRGARDDARGLRRVRAARRAEPARLGRRLWNAELPLDRELTRANSVSRGQEPVTAVQLSRGKAEAACCSRSRCSCRTSAGSPPTCCSSIRRSSLRALPADHDRLVDHAAEAQPRRVRARARPHGHRAGLPDRGAGISAKLPSGYHRDLQLIKPPLFRGIDLALATARIMAIAIDGVRFRADRIKLDPAIHAADRPDDSPVGRHYILLRRVGARTRA